MERGRTAEEEAAAPLSHRALYIGWETEDIMTTDAAGRTLHTSCRRETNFLWSWHLCFRFLILICTTVLIGICFLSWYYLRTYNESCNPAFLDNSILHSENILDPDVDPCDDFYSHVCGRWNISGSKESKYISVVEETDVRNLLRLESYLKCTAEDDLSGWSRFVKEIYDSCEEERRVTTQKSETVQFVRIIAEPLLQNDSKVVNLDDALRRIHHKLLQTGLFSWDVALDLRNDTIIQSLRLSPPKTPWNGDLNFPSKFHLIQYIAEILLLLGGEEPSVLKRSAEIADFVGLLKLRLNATTSRVRGSFNRKRLTFDELMDHFDFINFTVYFETVSPSDSVFVVIDEWQYFDWIRNYVHEDEENIKALRNFLVWSAIEFFVPYMPEEFALIRVKHLGHSIRKGDDFITNSHVCVNAVKKSVNFAASSFFMENFLDGDSRKMVNEIIFHVKNSYRDFLHTLQRCHQTDKKWLSGLESVFKNIVIGVPAHLQRIYEEPLPFNLTNASFPYNLLSAVNFTMTKMISNIEQVPHGVLFLPDFLQLNGAFINLPLLVINLGILTPPLFDPKQSLSSNYAGLGFVLAHELAHSVDHLGSFQKNHLKSVKQCLHQQYGDSHRIAGVTHEDFADNIGIRVAYNAFLDHVARHGGSCTEMDKRNFFTHYGQVLCEDGTSFSPEHNAYHSPYKHRVNMPLSNFPAFAEAFSCPNFTPMNNDNICVI